MPTTPSATNHEQPAPDAQPADVTDAAGTNPAPRFVPFWEKSLAMIEAWPTFERTLALIAVTRGIAKFSAGGKSPFGFYFSRANLLSLLGSGYPMFRFLLESAERDLRNARVHYYRTPEAWRRTGTDLFSEVRASTHLGLSLQIDDRVCALLALGSEPIVARQSVQEALGRVAELRSQEASASADENWSLRDIPPAVFILASKLSQEARRSLKRELRRTPRKFSKWEGIAVIRFAIPIPNPFSQRQERSLGAEIEAFGNAAADLWQTETTVLATTGQDDTHWGVIMTPNLLPLLRDVDAAIKC